MRKLLFPPEVFCKQNDACAGLTRLEFPNYLKGAGESQGAEEGESLNESCMERLQTKRQRLRGFTRRPAAFCPNNQETKWLTLCPQFICRTGNQSRMRKSQTFFWLNPFSRFVEMTKNSFKKWLLFLS